MWRAASILIASALVLLTLGIVMLASASEVMAEARYGTPTYFLTRQGLWLVVALAGALVAARVDYHHYRWAAIPILLICVVLLALVFVPGLGVEINGARRWLRLGPMTLQPSELAKPALVLWLSWWLYRARRHVDTFVHGLLLPGLPLGFALGLVFLGPDFGTAILMAAVSALLLFVGGARVGHLLIMGVSVSAAFAVAVSLDPVRLSRILAFLNPEKYAQREAYQLLQALLAFVVGGRTGAGLGQGLQKHFYLPEAHTDFIFAIIGEELGAIGTFGVWTLFVLILVSGFWIALNAADYFGRLIAFGLTSMIALQALINMAVVTGCLPTKGLPLPLISYGGSNLLANGIMVGMLVNVARHATDDNPDEHLQDVKDLLRAV